MLLCGSSDTGSRSLRLYRISHEDMHVLRPTRYLSVFAFLLVLLSEFSDVAVANDESLSTRFSRLEQVERGSFTGDMTEKKREDLIIFTYERLFPYDSSRIPGMSTEDIQASFKAAYLASFYGIKRKDIQQLEAYFTALDARNALRAKDFANLHAVYIEARMFTEANEIRAEHPELNLEEAPRLVNRTGRVDGRPSKLALADDNSSMLYETVDLRGKKLVVVGHPLCHFSADAIKEISHRDDLAQRFKNAIWIAPPSMRLNVAQMRSWSRTYPASPIAYVDKREDWPMFDAWATPTFYFLTDGKVVAKVQGWPPQGGEAALDKAFEAWNASKGR